MAYSRRELRATRRGRIGPPGRKPPAPRGYRQPPPGKTPRGRGRLKKLRILVILLGLSVLAMVSTIFGMMMAVASDLPKLEDRQQYKQAKNSIVRDVRGREIGTLTGPHNRILLTSSQISETAKQAIVAIEDSRFYSHEGVDFQGVGRAVVEDVLSQSASQGASTIEEQFVKNALEAQGDRTVFEKLREAALAYHLDRRWSKDKILTEYMNTIYFGEGAYGIESAARTYFGSRHPGCGQSGGVPCASVLLPAEAAMLAGVISSPTAYDPRFHPSAALARRNTVLEKMNEQGYLSDTDYHDAIKTAPPAPSEIEPPQDYSKAPYFTTWLRQQLVDKYGAGRTFAGGLQVRTTLDLSLQQACEQIVQNTLGGIAPTASIVVIDNRTGGIRAMVGGLDFKHHPFNIATQGHRQPGSAFKPFTLITALENGVSPDRTFTSEQKTFPVPHSPGEHFIVHNYDNIYAGVRTLADATTFSDNSVYAELGLDLGTKKIAKTARQMGISTPVSTNPAMILGGLKEGVTPLEMAYAYETIAHDGNRIYGQPPNPSFGPVDIQEVKDKSGKTIFDNKLQKKRIIPYSVDQEAISLLENVVSSGTGKHAATGGFAWGKTGTTENNGDAWFVGGTHEITVAVWVGHADSTQPMTTDFGGSPVDGGTYPALIWHDVVLAFQQIQAGYGVAHDQNSPSTGTSGASGSSGVAPGTGTSAPSAPQQAPSAPQQQAPATPAPNPAPTPAPPSGTGGSGGGPDAGGTG